jgi:mono/diheme cytochrome c family protein
VSFYWSFLLPLLFCVNVFGETCPVLKQEELSSERVYALTQNQACNIRSVKDLISHLPESFRNQYALFYRSRSIQGPMRTDYKRPRVILYDELHQKNPYKRIPSKFMLTFNSGEGDQAGANSIEMVDINTSGGKDDLDIFKYRDITFREGKAELSQVNPSRCKTCHGEPARPIYPGYPDWEGSFGSLHAHDSPPQEDEGLVAYENSLKAMPDSRYSLLGPTRDKSYSLRPTDKLAHGNDAINGELGQANAIRVARLMLKTPDFEKFKYAIAAGLLRCSGMESFVAPELAKQLHRNIDGRFSLTKKWPPKNLQESFKKISAHGRHFLLVDYISRKRFAKAFASSPSMERLYVDTFNVQGFSRGDPLGANLRFLFEGRNLNIDNYFLDLMQPTYRYHNGGGAAEQTVYELAKHDSELRNILKNHVVTDSTGIDRINRQQQLCASLKKKSLSATRKFKVTPLDPSWEAGTCVDCPKGLKPKLTPLPNSYPHIFTQSCASCHDSELDYAPPIPFSDPAKFRAWLNTAENAAKIQERLLHPDEERRMPQNKRLTEDEVNTLIRYISVER